MIHSLCAACIGYVDVAISAAVLGARRARWFSDFAARFAEDGWNPCRPSAARHSASILNPDQHGRRFAQCCAALCAPSLQFSTPVPSAISCGNPSGIEQLRGRGIGHELRQVSVLKPCGLRRGAPGTARVGTVRRSYARIRPRLLAITRLRLLFPSATITVHALIELDQWRQRWTSFWCFTGHPMR